MVKALHEADIEVILDVVYNHTAEGNHLGPTLSFRGIDNANYYRLVDDDQAHYFDTTGTGNSLLMRSPHVLQLIMDSLRYWVTEMHVDGFRFDLAATLARQFHEVDRLSAFFDLVHQDPVVSQVKLIAEPWDIGDGGYQVGGFPPLWSEWNGKYRDTRPRLLARRAVDARRVRQPPVGLVGPVRAHRPPADRERQLRHRARRLHAQRPRLLQREAQRGQRRGQQGRREPQPVLELRRRGSDGRPDDPRAARAPAAQLPHHAAALAGRPDARARRRAGPHPAGQQQRLLPGRPDLVDRLGPRPGRDRRCSSSRDALVRLRQDHPVFRRRRFFAGEPDLGGRVRPARPRLARAGRAPHADEDAWARRPRAGRHGVPQRRRDRRAGRARPGDRRRQLPGAVQRPARRGRRSRSRRAGSATSGPRSWTRTRRSRPAARSTAGATLAARARSRSSCSPGRSILPSPTSSGIGAVAAAASEAAKQVKGRGHGEAADDKPKRRTTKPRPSA